MASILRSADSTSPGAGRRLRGGSGGGVSCGRVLAGRAARVRQVVSEAAEEPPAPAVAVAQAAAPPLGIEQEGEGGVPVSEASDECEWGQQLMDDHGIHKVS